MAMLCEIQDILTSLIMFFGYMEIMYIYLVSDFQNLGLISG